MGALRVDFLELIIISYSGDTGIFMRRKNREEEEGDKGHIRNETCRFLHSP